MVRHRALAIARNPAARHDHVHVRVMGQWAGVGLTPGRSMVAENIRDLQNRARHARRALGGWLGAPELERDMLERAHDLTESSWWRPGYRAPCSRVWRDRAALGSPECRCCARADGWQSYVVRCAATRAYRSRPAEPRRGRADWPGVSSSAATGPRPALTTPVSLPPSPPPTH